MDYEDLGDLNKAIAFTRRAIAIQEKILPPEHKDWLRSKNNLAIFEQKLAQR